MTTRSFLGYRKGMLYRHHRPASAGALVVAVLVAGPALYFGTAGWILGLQARHAKTTKPPLPPRLFSIVLGFYEPVFFLADRFDAYDRWVLWQWDQVER